MEIISFNSILGTGWAFPPEFNRDDGNVEMVSAEKDINQSLNILLSTTLHERVMQPRYGCNLEGYVFNPLNASVIGFIRDLVTNAILFYEPRIVAERIEVVPLNADQANSGNFVIEIDYSIPGTNSRFNYVYDYYLNEALQPV